MSLIIKRLCIMLLVLPVLMANSTKPSGFKFHKGNLTTAKQKAAKEGKLYMVDFVAKWCMPCRWMEETTFSDPRVIKYLEDNYVAVKVDIDDFDGFAYKQLYDIKILPSILIFNSKGDIIDQYQESLSPTKMLKILQKHNRPENRLKATANQSAIATEYNTPQKPSHQAAASRPPSKIAEAPRPSAPQKPRPKKKLKEKPLADTPSKPATQAVVTAPQKPNRKPTAPTASKPHKAKPIVVDEGLFRFKVSRQASEGFSVQIGAFGEYGNVLREVAKLEELFNEPIIVHITKINGTPVYKIMLGEFYSRDKAETFKQQVVKNGLQAITKDLASI